MENTWTTLDNMGKHINKWKKHENIKTNMGSYAALENPYVVSRSHEVSGDLMMRKPTIIVRNHFNQVGKQCMPMQYDNNSCDMPWYFMGYHAMRNGENMQNHVMLNLEPFLALQTDPFQTALSMSHKIASSCINTATGIYFTSLVSALIIGSRASHTISSCHW